jgi:hypothetical protein
MSLIINYYGKDRNYFQYPQIKESGSRRGMIFNSNQNDKSLIIKEILRANTNEILPIFKPRFFTFFNAYFYEDSVCVISPFL